MTNSLPELGINNQATPSASSLRLIVCPHVLSIEKDRIDVHRPAGGTVRDLLRSIGWTRDGLSARVYLDGVLVQDAVWESVVPHAGQSVVVRAVPMGGDGQDKDALRIAAMIGVIAAAIAAPYALGALGVAALGAGTIGGAALAAGTSILGSLAINALIPPANQKMNDLSGQTNSSNTLALTGTSNQLIPYGVVPRVYGRHRIFPPLAAKHYTEIVGDQQYLRAVFCCGPGPLALSDFKIGEDALALFSNVEVEVRQGYPTDPPHTLYPSAVTEDPLSLPLTSAGGSLIRTSRPGATELSVDFTFLGLWFDHQAQPEFATVALLVEFRLQGDTDWDLASDTPAVPASLTTAFDGAHNDLVFTQPGFGSSQGNNLSVSFIDVGEQPSETLTVTPAGPGAFAFTVGLRKIAGVLSTALQVKAFLDASSFTYDEVVDGIGTIVTHTYQVTDWMTTTLAPGNDGSGSVTVMNPTYLAGGRDGVSALTFTDRRFTQFRVNAHWHTPGPGTYEIRVTRLTPDATNPEIHDLVYWTALRSVLGDLPVIPAGIASVAIRIRATDQLHGTLQTFNMVAHSILPDWDGRQWIARPTSNPASIFRDVHQGTANARPKPDSRMDLATIQGFHTRCRQLGLQFNAIIDFRSTVAELGRDVLAAGRATPGYRDGKISVVEDIPQTTPATLLTPRNSWGYKGTKIFVDLPHGLRVRFINADTLQQDERVVLADGYGHTGPDGIRKDAFGHPTSLPEATQFEAVDAGLGVTDPEQIFTLQRYHLAVLALRPETYQLSCDFEHLVMLRGDLVMVQHDVPLFGLISGRIKAVTLNAIGRTSAITLDEPCVMEAGERYGIRLRLADGSQVQREVVTVPGAQTTLTLLETI